MFRFFLGIALANLIFDFYFGFSNGLGVIIYSIILFLIINPKDFYKVTTTDLLALCIFIFLLLGVVFSAGEFSILVTFLKVFLSVAITMRVSTNFNYLKALPDVISWAMILQAMYTIITILYPVMFDYGNFLRPSASHLYNTYPADHYLRFRLYPASGQLVSGLAVVAGFCFMIISNNLFLNKNTHRLLNFFGLISSIFIGILSGRTFIVFVLFAFIIFMLQRPKKSIIYLLSFLFCSVFYFFATDGFSSAINRWAFEPIYNFIEYGKFSSASSDNLFEKHLFIPDFNFIFAHDFTFKDDGKWTAGTDSGILRYLFLGGPFFLLMILIYLVTILRPRINSIATSLLWTALAVAIMVKQEFITNASAACLYIFSYYFYLYSINNNPKLR